MHIFSESTVSSLRTLRKVRSTVPLCRLVLSSGTICHDRRCRTERECWVAPGEGDVFRTGQAQGFDRVDGPQRDAYQGLAPRRLGHWPLYDCRIARLHASAHERLWCMTQA